MAIQPRAERERRAPALAATLYYLLTALPFAITGAALWAIRARSGHPLPIAAVLVALCCIRQVNVFTVTALYHRSASHGSVQFHPVVERALRLWGWFFTGVGTRTWASIHRWHHATADTPDDPHSPSKPGATLGSIWKQSIHAFRSIARDDTPVARFQIGLKDDRLERFIRGEERRFFGVFGIRVPLLLGAWFVLFAGVLGLPPLWSAAAVVAILPGLTGAIMSATIFLINGLGHTIGYRNFDTRDTSTNLVRRDFLGFGEALHNNHHGRPGAANLAMLPDELDFGYQVLRLMHRAGLVTELRGEPGQGEA